MNFPMGVDEGYLPVWKEYSSMKAVNELLAKSDTATVHECFRLFIKDAEKNQKLSKTVKNFINTEVLGDIKSHVKRFGLFDNQRIRFVDYQLDYGEVSLVRAYTDISMTMRVVTRPSSAKLKLGFIINSFKNLLYKEIPSQLVSEVFGVKRRFKNVDNISERDIAPVKSGKHFKLYLSRTDNELVYLFKFQVGSVVPAYDNALPDLVRFYKTKLNGVL